MTLAPGSEVNVVLGGGGAKGYTHLGVLRELTDRGLVIKSLIGTSIGAIIGALFAYHNSREDGARDLLGRQDLAVRNTIDAVIEADFAGMGRLRLPSGGAFVGAAVLEEWLNIRLLNRSRVDQDGIRFSELGFDLVITATDACNGDELVLSAATSGDLQICHGARASMSIQGVFLPAEITVAGRKTLCWDGGISGNCRFDLACRLFPGRPTIASTLTYGGEPADPRRLGGIPAHSVGIFMRVIERLLWDGLTPAQQQSVLIVRPSVDEVGTLDFDISDQKKRTLINNGIEAARAELGR